MQARLAGEEAEIYLLQWLVAAEKELKTAGLVRPNELIVVSMPLKPIVGRLQIITNSVRGVFTEDYQLSETVSEPWETP